MCFLASSRHDAHLHRHRAAGTIIFLIVQEHDVPIPFPQPDMDFVQIIAMRLNDPRSSDAPDNDADPGPVGVDRELIARQLMLPEGFIPRAE